MSIAQSPWKIIPFGKIAEFKNGLNFRSQESGHKIKVLGVGDFKKNTVLDEIDHLSYIHTTKEINQSYHLQRGDLVFVRSNGNKKLVGRCILNRVNTGEVVSFSGFTIRARVNDAIVYPEFISLVMQNGILSKALVKQGAGTNISNLNQGILSNLKIPVPNKPTQESLLGFFAEWDKAIEKTEALITAKQKQFDWLIARLVNPAQNNGVKSITLQFQDIFKQFKKLNNDGIEREVLSVTKTGIVSQSDYFNKEVASSNKGNYLVADRKILVMSGLNFWMGAIDFQEIQGTGVVSPAYKTFKIISADVNYEYLRFFIRSQYMRKILIGASVQGASVVRRNLDMEMLLRSKISFPNISIQREVSQVLVLASHEIETLKALAEKYREQKRGLMQKLLSGEWQIPNSKKGAA